jgi:hypothetical protein
VKVEGSKQQQQQQKQQQQQQKQKPKQGRPRPLLPPASTWLKRIPHPSQLKAPTQVCLFIEILHRIPTMCTAVRPASAVHDSHCPHTHPSADNHMLAMSPTLPALG